jgi:hypothetical protein
VWDVLLQSEPLPRRFVPTSSLPELALAFAHFVDLKSPFTIGHSVGVARLCEASLARAGASQETRERGRVVGLLYDLGRASVPNGIWDKPGALNPVERERVEQHAYHSERVLARTRLFDGLATVVGRHHERLDGSGYHRGAAAAGIDELGRMVAAADVYHALREDRAHRPARPAAQAADVLAAEAKAGRLDRDAVSRDAFNKRDLDAYAKLFASDCVIEAPGFSGRGVEAARAFDRIYLDAFPGARIDPLRMMSRGGHVASANWMQGGKHQGPLKTPAGDIPPTGAEFNVPYCASFVIEDGRIKLQRLLFEADFIPVVLGLR